MKYEVIPELSRDEVEQAIVEDIPEKLLVAVVSASLYSDYREWAENVCLRLSNHKHFNVRGNAILGFGHLARIYGKLTERTVKPVIEKALVEDNEFVRGQANATADDVEFYLNWKIKRQNRQID